MLQGAIEEILLRHRALIDEAISPLQEDASIDGFLNDIESRVLALRQQEPSVWELRIVEYIHHVVQSELKEKLRLQAHDSKELEKDAMRVEDQIHASIREQLQRLLDILDHPEQQELQASTTQTKEHFLNVFWRNVVQFVATASNQEDEDAAQDMDGDIYEDADREAPSDAQSYQAITFDDLQFETGSINSAPSTEELPMILEAFNHERSEERKDALQRLSQISALELVHCSTQFPSVIHGLLQLLLDADAAIASDAMGLVYSILHHVEEPMQFATVYLSLIDMVGFGVTAGALSLESSELVSESESITQVVNVFRLLQLVMSRVAHHWIHFPHELLVRVLCSTFLVLMLEVSTSGKRPSRPIDILALLDPQATWLHKWTAKIPSREQLFLCMDECGFLSDLMYAMTRVRPFEIEMSHVDKLKVANMLTILARVAQYQNGRDLLFQWTKLPAHMQQQRRFTSWHGSEHQFRLETIPRENDRLFHFHRTDQETRNAPTMELEDGKPLAEMALQGVVLSAVVIFLLEPRDAQWLDEAVDAACRAIPFLPTHQEFLAILLQFVARCGADTRASLSTGKRSESATMATATTTTTTERELEDGDPWFPFRRPRAVDAVVKLVEDSLATRLASGQLAASVVRRRCARLVDSLFECSSRLPVLTSCVAAAVATATRARLAWSDASEEERNHAQLQIQASFFQRIQRMLETSPSTLSTLLFDTSTSIMPQLAHQLQHTNDMAMRDTIVQLVISLAQHSSAIHELHASGLWEVSLTHSLQQWQTTRVFDPSLLALLSLPAAARAFADCEQVRAELLELKQACLLDLDVALALNAPPQEAPYRLRRFAQSLTWLRAALATQHAGKTLIPATGSHDDAPQWTQFLVDAIVRHNRGLCRSSSQSEDLCTVAFDMATALAGSVPSMVALYDLLLRSGIQSLQPSEEDGGHHISACSFLAASLASSLAHVGANPNDWRRPRPLCAFQPEEFPAPEASTDDTPVSPIVFSASMTGALDHMLASIAESTRNDTPLDLSMLSQATWELIGDIEATAGSNDLRASALLLARAFGRLIVQLAQSGHSKLGESSIAIAKDLPLQTSAVFPTDAERKLLNTYYKDYCLRLGLRASPTTLHVLTKVFGTAAIDCFPVTMLMVLDQTHGEQEIIDVLQFCASCPSIFVLWPRISEYTNAADVSMDAALPSLLPLARAAEMVLEIEFPQIFATLRQCHCSVLTLVLRWDTQCYWNVLPWDKLVMMVYLNFLYGAEFQVYLVVAVLKHAEPSVRSIITQNANDSARAFVETLQMPVVDFRFSTFRNLFLRLRSTYHDRISHILQQHA